MFLFRRRVDGPVPVELAFTDREVDLHEQTGAVAVAEAQRRVSDEIGVPVVRMRQVHGAGVAVVTAADAPVVDDVDGLVTTEHGVALAARGADCGLVLLVDAGRGVVGAAHAGRQGLVAGVVPAAVQRMRDHGARSVHAFLGPHVCGRCYEVPEQMRGEVAAVVPAAAAETSWGTPAVDLGAGIRSQLDVLDVPWEDVGICTMEDERVWSHRRDAGAAGRVAGLVWMVA